MFRFYILTCRSWQTATLFDFFTVFNIFCLFRCIGSSNSLQIRDSHNNVVFYFEDVLSTIVSKGGDYKYYVQWYIFMYVQRLLRQLWSDFESYCGFIFERVHYCVGRTVTKSGYDDEIPWYRGNSLLTLWGFYYVYSLISPSIVKRYR